MEGCQVGKNEENLKSFKIEFERLVCKISYEELEEKLSHVEGIFEADFDHKLKAAIIAFEPKIITQKQVADKIIEFGCEIL